MPRFRTLSLLAALPLAVMLAGTVYAEEQEPAGGLQVELSEGAPPRETADRPPTAEGAPLGPAEIQAVLERLPPLKVAADSRKEFALREGTAPPPRTGETVQATFPPPEGAAPPDRPAAGALEVARFSPEGEVTLAPHLSVTFSQPMVPLTTHADLAAGPVPVKLTPEPVGQWRWVGTRTLLFEPDPRFPMATEYTAEVPEGTRSLAGGALASALRWTFTTPPPTLQQSHPTGGPHPLSPVLFCSFDQRIDPVAVLGRVRVEAGGKSYSVRAAHPDEIDADATVSQMVRQAEAGRWLAFRTHHPLPPATPVQVTLVAGTPSLEGPTVTPAPQAFTFRTYDALRVEEHGCGWRDECPPLAPWWIRFNNSIDADAFQESMVTVEPELPSQRVSVQGYTLQISGLSKGRSKYKVTLSRDLPDTFGQTLGRRQTLTFRIGSAPPALFASGGNMVVLDPGASPSFSVFTVNHDALKVKVHAVEPEQWWDFLACQRALSEGKTPSLPGRRVVDDTVTVKGRADELTETPIDLKGALVKGKGKTGQLVLLVEPTEQPENRWERRWVCVWVQVTRLGLDAFVDSTDVVAWATSLEDGKPQADVAVSLVPGGASGATAPDGLVTLPLEEGASRPSLLVGRLGDDTALLPEHQGWWGGGGWRRHQPADSLLWYVCDDRQMYRPGEEVHIKGWVRRFNPRAEGGVGALAGAAEVVSYQVIGPRQEEIASGKVALGALGGFDLEVTLPGKVSLGHARIQLQASGGTGSVASTSHVATFQIQEFRRPEFEVSASVSAGPHLLGEPAVATVQASYFAGGGLPDAPTYWTVTSSPGAYVPPGASDYEFGVWVPWWIEWYDSGEEETEESFEGHTDATGKHHLRLDFTARGDPRPWSVRADAMVMDVNRQAWSASTALLVHPSTLYVGLRSDRYFVKKGDPLELDAIVTDIDGRLVPGVAIELTAVRQSWEWEKNGWVVHEKDPQSFTQTSTTGPVRFTVATREGGTYRITARIQDAQERPNQTRITRWVSGGQSPTARRVEQEQATLIPDRREYQPGDVAEILVESPFTPAEGLLTVRRSGIVRTERFTLDGPTHTLRVPILEEHIPNVTIQVDLVGSAARTDDQGKPVRGAPPRPAFAAGSLDLPVPPYSRTLSVKVMPAEPALEPGAETMVDVIVKNGDGKAVENAELALVVVDEAILALTGYRLPDPIPVFYPHRDPDTSDHHLRASILLVDPTELANQALEKTEELMESEEGLAAGMDGGPMPPPSAPGAPMERAFGARGGGPGQGGGPEPIRMRMDFNPLAAFVPSVRTSADGHARIPLKLPDNLTRYRLMAVAVAGGEEFGGGEATLTARLPLMVRPSPPRFLSFGDTCELPVVVQNQTSAPLAVDVALRAANVDLIGTPGQRVTVPGGDRVEVRFPVAASTAGTVHLQAAAVSGEAADAAELSFPVWTPVTTEAFATYGEIDAGYVVQPVARPPDVVPQFGGLEITTSATALQALTDAVLYLQAYPFECAEQISSRVVSVAALRDVLVAFEAEGLPTPEAMTARMAEDIDRLQALQNPDGGFGFWRRAERSWPYISIHVAHALARAREKGYAVPRPMVNRSLRYLQNIDQHLVDWYSEESKRSLRAYAAYVRKRLGDPDAPSTARSLLKKHGVDGFELEPLGWLLWTLSGDPASDGLRERIHRRLANRVTETAGAASFATSYSDGAQVLLFSSRRADAVILEALIADRPASDLIPKVVRGLLAHRTKGRWGNTQENAFVLLALDLYFATYEKETPDFVARAWLGDGLAGEHAFEGRTTDYHNVSIPMSYLVSAEGTQDLVLGKEGPGRLYYRLGLRYAPASLVLDPADHGFTVERTYEPVNPTEEGKPDVWKGDDGIWHFRAGAEVRVRLTLVAPARRYHVALVDPLPGGLEPMNPALAVTGDVPQDPDSQKRGPWWWHRPWYEHQNLRDERVEAFTSLLPAGVFTYTYVARATTPGRFVIPPTRAEEMYAPETFGRSASERCVVE